MFSKMKLLSIVIIAIFISCLGLYLFFYDIEEDSSNIGDAVYEAIMLDRDVEEKISLLNSVIEKSGKSNYKYLAKFKLAAIYATKDLKKSQEIYDKLASDKSMNKQLKNLAEYLGLVLSFKNDNNAVFKGKINKAIKDSSSIYWAEIRQLLAISLIRDNDVNAAIGVLKEMESNSEVNNILRNSIRELLQIYDN